MRAFLTGGGGFVGSAIARALIARGDEALSVDWQKSSASPGALQGLAQTGRFATVKADVTDRVMISALIREYRPDCIIHAVTPKPGASIAEHSQAVREALVSVFLAATAYRVTPHGAVKENYRVVLAATDNVFAPLAPSDAAFGDKTGYDPLSLEGAAEAGNILLARAWGRCRNIPVIIGHSGPLYGPWQSKRGFVPNIVHQALSGGDIVVPEAETVRDWLFVEDYARGVAASAERGRPDTRFMFGGHFERRMVDVARAICTLLDAKRPRADGASYADAIIVDDEMLDVGLRYGFDPSQTQRALQWRAEESLHAGLARTVDWALSQSPDVTPRPQTAAQAAE